MGETWDSHIPGTWLFGKSPETGSLHPQDPKPYGFQQNKSFHQEVFQSAKWTVKNKKYITNIKKRGALLKPLREVEFDKSFFCFHVGDNSHLEAPKRLSPTYTPKVSHASPENQLLVKKRRFRMESHDFQRRFFPLGVVNGTILWSSDMRTFFVFGRWAVSIYLPIIWKPIGPSLVFWDGPQM